MDNFQIETAQNVTISHQAAGVGERILAYLIDSTLIVIYVVLIIWFFYAVNIGDSGLFLIYMTVGLPLFLYHLVWETLWNGQTPGKAVLKIRVVRMDGSKPTFSNFLLRWLLRILDISFTSDIAAGTTVISEKTKISLADTVYEEIDTNYSPSYPQVTLFTDLEMQEIKTLFQNARWEANHHIILILSKKVATILEVAPQEKPIHFLEKVIKDYTYYTQ